MGTEKGSDPMRIEIGLTTFVALVWALLGLAYALAPWGDMIGYAWVWGVGAALFAALAIALGRSAATGRRSPADAAGAKGEPGTPPPR